jgi:hypothetical protein
MYQQVHSFLDRDWNGYALREPLVGMSLYALLLEAQKDSMYFDKIGLLVDTSKYQEYKQRFADKLTTMPVSANINVDDIIAHKSKIITLPLLPQCPRQLFFYIEQQLVEHKQDFCNQFGASAYTSFCKVMTLRATSNDKSALKSPIQEYALTHYGIWKEIQCLLYAYLLQAIKETGDIQIHKTANDLLLSTL